MPDYNLGTARGKIELDADDVNRSTRRARDAVDDYTKGLGDNEKALNKNEKANKSLYGALVRAGIGLGFVGRMIGTIAIPILTTAIGSAIGAVGALAAGTIGLVSALSPLVGLLPAAAAGVAALAQGAGVAVLALSNLEDGFKDSIKAQEKVDKAQTKLNDAIADFGKGSKEAEKAAKKLTDAQRDQARVLEGYSPIAAEFILTVMSMKKPFEDLRDATQERMFPGLISGIKTLTPLIERFRPALLNTAGVIGDFVAKAANLAASPLFSSRLVRIAEGNVLILERLGDVALGLAPALVTLTAAGQPLVDRFLELATRSAEAFSQFINGADANGDLAAFMETTKDTAATLFSILKGGALVLYDMGQAAFDLGQKLFEALDRNIAKAREFTDSLEGGGRLREFFDSAREPLSAIASLLGEMGRSFGRMFEDLTPQFAGIADSLRVNLLPSLENLFSQMDGEFFDSVIKLTASLADFFAVFVLGTPVFGAILDAFAGFLDAAVGLIDALGPLGPVLLNVLAAFGAYTTVRIAVGALLAFRAALAAVAVPWLPTVGTLVGKLWASFKAYGILGTVTAGLWNFAGVIDKVIVAVKGAAVALGGLIAAHPIIAAIIAIGAAVFIAYKKFEPFREAVDKAWQALQRFWDNVLEFGGKAVDFFSRLPEIIGGAISGIVAKASEMGGQFVDTVARFFSELPGRVTGFLAMVVAAVSSWVSNMATKASEAGSRFLQSLLTFISQLPNRIAYWLGFVIGRVILWSAQMLVWAIRTAQNFQANVVRFFSQLPGRVASFLANVISRVIGWAGDMISNARRMGSQFLSNVVNFFRQLPGRVASFLSNTISRVASWVGQMASRARDAGSRFVSSAASALAALPGRVSSILGSVIGAIGGFIGRMASSARQAASSFVSGISSGLSGLPGIVSGVIGRAISAFTGMVGRAFSAARDVASSLWSGFKAGLGISSPSFIERAMFALNKNVEGSIKDLGKQVRQIQGIGARLNAMDLGGNVRAMNAGRSPSLQIAGGRGAGVLSTRAAAASSPTTVGTGEPAIGKVEINNPVGETSEDSLQRTILKLSALGAL